MKGDGLQLESPGSLLLYPTVATWLMTFRLLVTKQKKPGDHSRMLQRSHLGPTVSWGRGSIRHFRGRRVEAEGVVMVTLIVTDPTLLPMNDF